MKAIVGLLMALTVPLLAAPAWAGSSAGVVSDRMAQRAPIAEGAFGQANRGNCARIVTELKRQGAPSGVAYRLGNTIAWRESGCSMQCVSDRDDHACSRFGLNFKGSMGRYWGRLCGAFSREATKSLYTDAKCALAAYRTMGWRPWR